MLSLAKGFIAVSAVGVALYAVYAYFWLAPGSTVHPSMRAAYAEHPARILLHAGAGAVALLTGPWQFFPALRRRKRLHRALGFVYFTAVLVSGVAGLFTAAIAFGGLVARVGFGVLAVVWLWSSAAALLSVRRGDYPAHETWALRSYALTLSAVTLRYYLGLFGAAGFAFEQTYPLVAWLCWVPNLVLVEWVILRRNVAGR